MENAIETINAFLQRRMSYDVHKDVLEMIIQNYSQDITVSLLDFYHIIPTPFRAIGLQYLLSYAPFTYDVTDCLFQILLNTQGVNPFSELSHWLEKLKVHETNHQRIISPYLILFSNWNTYGYNYYWDQVILMQTFIELGFDISNRQLQFIDQRLNARYQQLELPDAVWMAAMTFTDVEGKSALRLVLPYWNTHPLALLLTLDPKTEERSLPNELFYRNAANVWFTRAINLFPILAKIGGPIPFGPLYNEVKHHINYLDSYEYPGFKQKVVHQFNEYHSMFEYHSIFNLHVPYTSMKMGVKWCK